MKSTRAKPDETKPDPLAGQDRQDVGAFITYIETELGLSENTSVARVWFRFALSALGTAVLPLTSCRPSAWMLWNVC